MKARTFEIGSQEYKRDPYPTLAEMLAQGPLVRMKYPFIGRFWAVTRYDEVNELLRDRETFVRDPRTAGLKKGANLPWWFPRSLKPMTEGMIIRDEPDHRRLRSLVEQAFVRRNVEQLRPRFTAIATQMLDDLETAYRQMGQPVDLVAGLARPFPLAVICELLGLPRADRPMFVKQAERIANSPSLVGMFKMFGSIRRIMGYTREQIAAAKRAPQEGLISALVAAEHDGQRMSEDEMLSMILLLLFAGHITTVHLIGAGIYTLLGYPEQQQALMADWSQVGGAVDEMLRYLSPVQTTKPMMPIRDIHWHGQPLKRGEKILALLAAANVDPRRFDDPERFDIKRHPNPHVAFGAGTHICLGLKLAVAETEIALEQLLTRFPQLELAIPRDQVRWSRQPGTRGMETLPVRLW
ncbi:MAG: cytochrome P450 [Pirellulales bacterium]